MFGKAPKQKPDEAAPQQCPMCKRHCPVNAVRCMRGKLYVQSLSKK